jgi:hypothetical protein
VEFCEVLFLRIDFILFVDIADKLHTSEECLEILMRSPPPGRDRLGWNYMSAEWVLETFFQRVAGWTYDYSQTLIDVFFVDVL